MNEIPGKESDGGGMEDPLPRFLESKDVSKKRTLDFAVTGKKVVLGILGLVLVALIFQMIFLGKKIKSAPAVKPAPQAARAAVSAARLPRAAAPVPGEEKPEASGRASPFALAQVKTEAAPIQPREPVLQGILTDAHGEAIAVINEKIVKKGARVADNLIKDIHADSVLLQKDSGEEWTLRMKS